MSKKELRQEMLFKMTAFSRNKHQKALADKTLSKRLIATDMYQKASCLATYLPMPHEYDTRHLIAQALMDQKTVLVPKVFPNGKMIFVTYDEASLQKTTFGFLEPLSHEEVPAFKIDMIHVPGLVFSPEGYRIGYGGGYFDRYLTDYQGETVSTIYPFQLQNFAKEPFDLPVRKLISL